MKPSQQNTQKSGPLPGSSRIISNGMFENPFIWADIPDPDVIRVGDVYYMVSTTMYFSPHCPIMKSYDLVNWEIVSYVCDVLEYSDAFELRNGSFAYGRGTWAASLRYNKGTFYVTVASFTTNKTYIFQTENVENGCWRRYEIDHMYHDQSLLFDDDGRVYLISGAGKIHIVELTEDATAVKPGGLDQILLNKTDVGGKGGLPAEGAHFYKINGYYYVFLIAWPPSGSGRRIQLCYRADKLLGPYEGKVILDDNMGFLNNGVAQGGVVDTPDGKWYALLFQDHGAVGRIPVLVPLKWVDSWPELGTYGVVPKQMELPYIKESAVSVVSPDEFDAQTCEDDLVASKLSLVWQWNHNPDNNLWSLTDRYGHLRLKSGYLSSNLLDAKNTLTQRTFGPVCTGTAALDISGMMDGDVAGLAALQDVYGYVGVKVINGRKYISMTNSSSGTPEEVESIQLTGDKIYLRIEFDFRDTADKAKFFYSEDETHWRKIGDVLKMEYRLSHFTGYRFALFYYSTQSIGGYADFDYFRIF